MAALLAFAGATRDARATQAASVRIRGAAAISATARASSGGLEVRGGVADDAGHALGGARLKIQLLADNGKPLALPLAHKCPPTTGVELARGFSAASDAYILETDTAGGFCLRVDGTFETGKVAVSFQDDAELFDAARELLEIDASRHTLQLGFSPQPSRLNLAQPHQTLFVDSQVKPPMLGNAGATSIRVDLSMSEANQPGKPIATATLSAGGRGQFEFPSAKLGEPGRATLVATFAGSEQIQPTQTRIVVSRTAQVGLTLVESHDVATWNAGTSLQVAVGYVGGAVPGGSVEARVMGRTVGIAPVRAGAANVQVRVESSRRQLVGVTLHYLPDAPWWIAGPPLEAQVMTVNPSGWARWTWAALAGLVAGWTAWAWRRPRRKSTLVTSVAPTRGRAGVEFIRKVPKSAGWSGHVLDAHDGRPIEGAQLAIVGPSFRESGLLRAAVTTRDGSFSLSPLPTPFPEGVELRISAAEHATLEQALPPEGEIAVHLSTRRRALLHRLVRWVERRGPPYTVKDEPTPGEVALVAESHQERTVEAWARGVERAAYGPAPPDAAVEQSLIDREPGS